VVTCTAPTFVYINSLDSSSFLSPSPHSALRTPKTTQNTWYGSVDLLFSQKLHQLHTCLLCWPSLKTAITREHGASSQKSIQQLSDVVCSELAVRPKLFRPGWKQSVHGKISWSALLFFLPSQSSFSILLTLLQKSKTAWEASHSCAVSPPSKNAKQHAVMALPVF
jgi:hypothetical protein